MRRYLPAFLLALAAIAPFPLAGCDLLSKKDGADAAADAAIVAVPVADAAVAVATDTAAPTTTVAPPLVPGKLTPTPTGTVIAPKTDAAAPVADAGAVKTDSGAAPAPTPTLTLPTNLFDGGFTLDDVRSTKLAHGLRSGRLGRASPPGSFAKRMNAPARATSVNSGPGWVSSNGEPRPCRST